MVNLHIDLLDNHFKPIKVFEFPPKVLEFKEIFHNPQNLKRYFKSCTTDKT